MRSVKPLRLLLLLLPLVLLGACSSIGLGYGQAPRLIGWWVDGYFDLDRAQSRQLDAALRELQDWHRREELPQWRALLRQASAASADGRLDTAEILALEQATNASIERLLDRAAPLAAPWLASLRPEQWQRLRERRAERLAEWQEERADDADGSAFARQFQRGLERWLGTLERPLRQRLQRIAAGWGSDEAALWAERAQRQQLAEQGLRAWAQGDLLHGRQLLMQAGARDLAALGPATLHQRTRTLEALQSLLAEASPAQWQRARKRWDGWQRDLQALEPER